jgi:hypothetical protein
MGNQHGRELVEELNSASIKTSVEIIDDWDESDRVKVNPIVGQAGIQGGSGAVTALTTRTTISTDDALVVNSTALAAAIGTDGSAAPTKNIVTAGVDPATGLDQTHKTDSDGVQYTQPAVPPSFEDSVNGWANSRTVSHASNVQSDPAAATVNGTDEASAVEILASTNISTYRGWTVWVQQVSGAVALTHVYVYASRNGTNWTCVDVLKNELEVACDTLAAVAGTTGIAFTCTSNPGWLYIKAKATVAAASTTAIGVLSYQM